jgi:hypothetical protein
MFFSRNEFFKQEVWILAARRTDVETLLTIKEVDAQKYLIAYDYFSISQTEFDGATIVKDLNDIPELDLNAMLHDYRYITDFGVFKKFKWDYEYLQGMNDLGKGYRTGRFIALILSSVFFTPYKLLSK